MAATAEPARPGHTASIPYDTIIHIYPPMLFFKGQFKLTQPLKVLSLNHIEKLLFVHDTYSQLFRFLQFRRSHVLTGKYE